MKFIPILIFLCLHSLTGQGNWNLTGSFGLVELRTEYPELIKNGNLINGWKVAFAGRYYFNKFYAGAGIEGRCIDIFGDHELELFNVEPMHYSIHVPLLAGFDLFHNDHFKWRIFAGVTPYYIFKVDKNQPKITEDNFSTFNAAYTIGSGFDFYPIFFDFNYDMGFSNYYKNPDFSSHFYGFTLGMFFK